jgi:hypothetical protein
MLYLAARADAEKLQKVIGNLISGPSSDALEECFQVTIARELGYIATTFAEDGMVMAR